MAEAYLETERLILRRWRDTDREPFAAMNADPQVMEFFLAELTREQSDSLVDRIEAHFDKHGFGLFALETKGEGDFIGFTGLQICHSSLPVADEVEIGWRLARKHWRKGYAYEAAEACIDWLWQATDFERLISFTSQNNTPSQNLMRKLGLTHQPSLSFDHPAIPDDHPQCRQVVFAINRASDTNG